jgi:hypothetical protein
VAQLVSSTRVQIVWPCGNDALYRAANQVVALLLDEQNIQAWGGLTYSTLLPPVFVGQFWNEGQWEEDENALIFIDVPDQSAGDLIEYLAALRSRIVDAYTGAGQPQKAVWITTQPLQILTD